MTHDDPAAKAIGLVTSFLVEDFDPPIEFEPGECAQAVGYLAGVLAGTIHTLAEELGVQPLDLWARHALYHATEEVK